MSLVSDQFFLALAFFLTNENRNLLGESDKIVDYPVNLVTCALNTPKMNISFRLAIKKPHLSILHVYCDGNGIIRRFSHFALNRTPYK